MRLTTQLVVLSIFTSDALDGDNYYVIIIIIMYYKVHLPKKPARMVLLVYMNELIVPL